jgi:hypothetical protein
MRARKPHWPNAGSVMQAFHLTPECIGLLMLDALGPVCNMAKAIAAQRNRADAR